jgi:hypothetical protein
MTHNLCPNPNPKAQPYHSNISREHVHAYLFNENAPKAVSDKNQRSLWLLVIRINQQHRLDLRYNLLSDLTTEKAQALQQGISLMDESFFIGPKGWTRFVRVQNRSYIRSIKRKSISKPQVSALLVFPSVLSMIISIPWIQSVNGDNASSGQLLYCRLHKYDQRLSVGINNWILTEDLSTNK